METFNGREVIRCMHCKLNQFVVSSRKCRRCHQLVEPPPPLAVVENPFTALAPLGGVSEGNGAYNWPLALRLLRNAFELSQRELAARLGCPRTYISKNESRHNMPTLETVRRFSEAFGITSYAFISLAEALAR